MMRIFITIVFLSFNLVASTSSYNSAQDNNIEHVIQVIHPGVSTSVPVDKILVEVKDASQKTTEFYMDVETVLCSDDQCRIDMVKIYWDTLGFYKRLQIPDKIHLEKAAGENFNRVDYDKLNNILSNRNCSLRNVYKEEVVGTESSDGVDAISGATIILNTNDYIQGAVWTCYTLWHWVHGDTHQIIRNITGDRLTSNELILLCKNGNENEKIFSIEQLIRRKEYSKNVTHALSQMVSEADFTTTKLLIEYFENATSNIYYACLEKAVHDSNPKQRKNYLNSLNNYQEIASIEFYERLVSNVSKWNGYDEINRMFNILNKKHISSPQIENSILLLLDQEDFVVARAAYWFLSEIKVSNSTTQKLNIFYKSNAERL